MSGELIVRAQVPWSEGYHAGTALSVWAWMQSVALQFFWKKVAKAHRPGIIAK